jgi:hypothetical protein
LEYDEVAAQASAKRGTFVLLDDPPNFTCLLPGLPAWEARPPDDKADMVFRHIKTGHPLRVFLRPDASPELKATMIAATLEDLGLTLADLIADTSLATSEDVPHERPRHE